MSSSIAEFLLMLAMLLACCQILLPLLQAPTFWYKTIPLALLSCVLLSFALLMHSFIISDMSVLLVANHSHISKPLIYKVAGTWGNHEGSMLMWVLVLALFNAIIPHFAKYHKRFLCITMSVHGLIIMLFTLYVMHLSSPFIRVFPTPVHGMGLNPMLQDIGLALHPPTLYLGYVGFSIVYALAIGAIVADLPPKMWARIALPFALGSWFMLTIGIALGSWWAYRELGWGGYWFWDPVENASLIPWLSGASLLHALLMDTRSSGKGMQLSLVIAILTFSLSCVGTFLVRSGAITSVHSFATDPHRGLAILSIAFMLMFGGLSMVFYYSWRIRDLAHKTEINTRFLKMSSILLLFLAISTVFGTIYPIIANLLTQNTITIGRTYYDSIFTNTTIAMLLLCFMAPYYKHIKSYIIALSAAVLVIALWWHMQNIIYALSMVLGGLLIADNAWQISKMIGNNRSIQAIPSRIGHLGFGLLVVGIALNSYGNLENDALLRVGQASSIRGYEIRLQDISYAQGPNYVSKVAKLEVWKKERMLGNIWPEVRFYPIEKKVMAETDILHLWDIDIYTAIADGEQEDELALRIYLRPFMSLIWFAAMLIAMAGLGATVVRLHACFKNIR